MKEKNYKLLLDSFLQEVKKMKNPSFINIENWTIADDLLNGVIIGHTITDQSDRELLHSIGLKHSLIPLCPGEVVDIDVSSEGKIIRSFVRTIFGKLQIRRLFGSLLYVSPR